MFLTHRRKGPIGEHYDRLRTQSASTIKWKMLFDPANAAKPYRALGRRAQALMPQRHAQLNPQDSLMGGFLDYVIVPAALATKRDYVWVFEYDVDWTGDWAAFFEQFADNDADLLTTTVATHDEAPEWYHWRSAVAPPNVPRSEWVKAFHPIMRMSRKMMEQYVKAMAEPGWAGHYEFTLPTIARHFGLKVEDFGGEGSFSPAERRDKFYRNSPHDYTLSPGTFVWRPSFDKYFAQDPEGFEPNTLYHPIKSGVSEWEIERKRNEDGYNELKASIRRKHIASALAATIKVQPKYLLSRLTTDVLNRR